MYAYEYGLNNFNEVYKPYDHITLFNDDIEIEYDKIGQTEGVGMYIKVTLDENTNTASIVINEGYEQYPAKLFEEYLSKIGNFSNTGQTRIINGLPNQINRPIVEYNNKFFALILDAVELEPIILTQIPEKPKGHSVKISRKKVLAKVLLEVEEDFLKKNISMIVMISDDGLKLQKAYQDIKTLLPNEILILIENNVGSNITGNVFRARFGSEIKSSDIKGEEEIPYATLAYLCSNYLAYVGKKVFREVIIESFKNRNKKGNSFLVNFVYNYLDNNIEKSAKFTGVALDILTLSIHKNLRSNDINSWKAHDDNGKENPDFSPFLLGYDKIKELEEEAKKKNIQKVLKELAPEKTLSNFYNSISELESSLDATVEKLPLALLSSNAEKKLKGVYFLLYEAKKHAKNTIELILNKVKTTSVVTTLKNIYLYINAYIIGLYNSLVDAVTGIIQILSMVFKLITSYFELKSNLKKNTSLTISMILEFSENVLDVIANIFTLNNIKALIDWKNKQIIKIITYIIYPEKAKNKAKAVFSNLTFEQVGYASGYIVGFIISEVLITMALGGANTFAKAATQTFEEYYSIVRGVAKAPITATKGILKVGKFSIEFLISLFRNLQKRIRKLPELLRKFDNWIDELLKAANKLIDDTFIKLFPDEAARKTITDAGLKPTKVNAAGDTITFCPIK